MQTTLSGTTTLSPPVTRTYAGIDLMKFLAAILVVSIHTRPFYDIDPRLGFVMENILTRIAVPFFFISSGYFFTDKVLSLSTIKQKRKALGSFLLRIFQLYLLWSLIYMPYDLYYLYKETPSIKQVFFTYLRQFFVIGSHFHFWYLPSLIYSTLLVYFFVEVNRFRTLLAVCILLYVIGILGDSYFGLLPKNTLLYQNYAFFLHYFDAMRTLVFFGAIFVALGAVIAWYQPRFSKKRLVTCIGVCGVLYLAEVLLLEYNQLPLEYNMYLFLVPLVTFLFLLMRKLYFTFLQPYSKTFRMLSVGIYCSHALFLDVCYRILEKLQVKVNEHNTLFFVVVLCFSAGFVYLLSLSKNKWIQQLIA